MKMTHTNATSYHHLHLYKVPCAPCGSSSYALQIRHTRLPDSELFTAKKPVNKDARDNNERALFTQDQRDDNASLKGHGESGRE